MFEIIAHRSIVVVASKGLAIKNCFPFTSY